MGMTARVQILGFFETQKIEPSAQMRLWVYAKAGALDEVKKALDDGADVNLQNLQGMTAAHIPSINDNEEIVELLKERGAIFEKASKRTSLMRTSTDKLERQTS